MTVLAAFLCLVTQVHDGDGPLWCASGQKVRIAGVQAPDYENAEPCRQHRAGYVCDDAAAERSRVIMQRLVLGQRLTCRQVDTSYRRVVARCTLADGRSLSCAAIASGAAVRWNRYWKAYKMEPCRG